MDGCVYFSRCLEHTIIKRQNFLTDLFLGCGCVYAHLTSETLKKNKNLISKVGVLNFNKKGTVNRTVYYGLTPRLNDFKSIHAL